MQTMCNHPEHISNMLTTENPLKTQQQQANNRETTRTPEQHAIDTTQNAMANA